MSTPGSLLNKLSKTRVEIEDDVIPPPVEVERHFRTPRSSYVSPHHALPRMPLGPPRHKIDVSDIEDISGGVIGKGRIYVDREGREYVVGEPTVPMKRLHKGVEIGLIKPGLLHVKSPGGIWAIGESITIRGIKYQGGEHGFYKTKYHHLTETPRREEEVIIHKGPRSEEVEIIRSPRSPRRSSPEEIIVRSPRLLRKGDEEVIVRSPRREEDIIIRSPHRTPMREEVRSPRYQSSYVSPRLPRYLSE